MFVLLEKLHSLMSLWTYVFSFVKTNYYFWLSFVEESLISNLAISVIYLILNFGLLTLSLDAISSQKIYKHVQNQYVEQKMNELAYFMLNFNFFKFLTHLFSYQIWSSNFLVFALNCQEIETEISRVV